MRRHLRPAWPHAGPPPPPRRRAARAPCRQLARDPRGLEASRPLRKRAKHQRRARLGDNIEPLEVRCSTARCHALCAHTQRATRSKSPEIEPANGRSHCQHSASPHYEKNRRHDADSLLSRFWEVGPTWLSEHPCLGRSEHPRRALEQVLSRVRTAKWRRAMWRPPARCPLSFRRRRPAAGGRHKPLHR